MILQKKNSGISKKNINSNFFTKRDIEGNFTRQLNLKISKKLLDEIELYSQEFGYNNAQELIREAIRDKIYGCDIVRSDYLEKLLTDEDFITSIGDKQSMTEYEELQKRINNG